MDEATAPLRQAAGMHVERFGDAAVLYDPRSDRFHRLNAAACAVWDAAAEGGSRAALSAAGRAAGLDAAETDALLATLLDEGLLASHADG